LQQTSQPTPTQPIHISVPEELPLARIYLVAGPAASGKTTFSSRLATERGALVLSMDDYYVDENEVIMEYDEKYGLAPQWESPDAYDMELLQRNIDELLHTGTTQLPVYSFALNRRTGYRSCTLQPGQSVVIEGLYTIRYSELFTAYTDSTVKVFIIADEAIRRARSAIRDVQERGKPLEVLEKRLHFVEMGERRWVLNQAANADYIIETNQYDPR
jgi:uridine kinase